MGQTRGGGRFLCWKLTVIFFLGYVVSTATVYAAGPVKVMSEKRGEFYVLIATNSSAAPYQLVLSLTEATNITADRPLPITTVLPRYVNIIVASLRPANPRQSHSFRYQYSSRYGDPRATHDPQATYRLPFEAGKEFTIGQAWGGTLTTHNSPESQFAVDIPMPTGTTIVAARSGIVTDVVRPF